MKYILISTLFALAMSSELIFDFDQHSNLRNWIIVDDVVMGGRSAGKFQLTKDGFGLFNGNVSLENNGGFSSVRYRFDSKNVNDKNILKIRLKGDGKRYQIRIKDFSSNYYSYISYVETNGEWQDVEVALNTMYPTFRGRRLNMPNFAQNQIEEIAILISNKKAEKFDLLLDYIEIK